MSQLPKVLAPILSTSGQNALKGLLSGVSRGLGPMVILGSLYFQFRNAKKCEEDMKRRAIAQQRQKIEACQEASQILETKMIEQILTRKNMLQAMYKVQKNHGSAGVDHMPVTKLSELMSVDKEELTANVRSGKYLPQAILGVEISKGEGKTRLLGIPTEPTVCFNKRFYK